MDFISSLTHHSEYINRISMQNKERKSMEADLSHFQVWISMEQYTLPKKFQQIQISYLYLLQYFATIMYLHHKHLKNI